MEIHYNAFISYRHHPDDIRVASEIHRSLERFKVPRPIRKKAKVPMRLFRDKEELPITSNLTDDIGSALRNSDFLIVICSVHTKESIWVQREIELFLQTHHRSRVLTVLASGEPYDVIPEILLHEDVKDPVTGEITRLPVEPLSCDWRIPRRKAKREELPRLAAPLLGCSYDELRQRQKQYRTRRNTAIVSAALVASFSLTAYFLYTSITIQKKNVEISKANEEIKAANIRIQENLDQSLINQSRHLATAAQERLVNGDRLTAITLAMAALPGEDNVRPYVPEAEAVLISALGVYNTSNQMAAVGAISPGVNVGIRSFWVTDSETVMYIRDQRNVITVWDLDTLQQNGEIALGDSSFDKLITLPNDNAVIMAGEYGDSLYCYRPDGTLLWTLEDCSDVAYQPDSHVLLIIRQTGISSHHLQYLDPDTGEDIGQAIELDIAGTTLSPTNLMAQSCPETVPVLIRYYDFGQSGLYLVDRTTGEIRQLDTESAYPTRTLLTRDGKVLLLYASGSSAIVEGNRVMSPYTGKIICYDTLTGALLWENEISSSVYSGAFTMEEIPDSGNVLCQSGNVFLILNKETGETVSQCEAGSGILSVSVEAQYAYAVLQDGYDCLYLYDFNSCYENKCMNNGVDQAVAGEGCYALHWYGDQVTVYREISGEPAWKYPFEAGFSVSKQMVHDRYVAFQDYSNLYLFDSGSKSLIWKTEKGNYDLLGFSRDGSKLWYAAGKESVIALEIATGNTTAEKIPVEDESIGGEIRGTLYLDRDCLYYTVGGLEQPKVVVWDLNTRQTQSCALQFQTEEDITYWSWEVLAAQQPYLWILGQNRMLLELDMATGSVQCLAEKVTQRPAVAIHSSGKKVAVTDQGMVLLKTPGQTAVTTVAPENANAGSVYFNGDELLVLCDNGFVCRFDGSGNLLSQTELTVSSTFSDDLLGGYISHSKISWHFTEDNKLILNALGEGNIIDCESWSVSASISGFLMCSENDLVCKLGTAVVGFPMYETAELLQLAQEELQGFRLTQEQKVSYGID